jgi:hypothetical protein
MMPFERRNFAISLRVFEPFSGAKRRPNVAPTSAPPATASTMFVAFIVYWVLMGYKSITDFSDVLFVILFCIYANIVLFLLVSKLNFLLSS